MFPLFLSGTLAGSPLARTWEAGTTPAYAGKTFPTYQGCISGKDHPRVCGENYYPFPLNFPTQGSPPRVRGRLPTF